MDVSEVADTVVNVLWGFIIFDVIVVATVLYMAVTASQKRDGDQ